MLWYEQVDAAADGEAEARLDDGGGAQVRSLPGPLLLRQPPAPPRLPWSILVRCIS